jgi:histone deacetylase complex regulatory component SIN3
MTLVQEIIDSGIDLTVMQGYWTILNNENIVVHTIWESEIAEVMDEREMQFEEAFLSILESIEEPKKGSDNLH